MPRNVALLACVPGYDGGLKQTFALEVREHKNLHSRVLASVQSSPIPLFNMRYLKHGEDYLFIVTAVNDRGTSLPVTVSFTVPEIQHTPMASNSYDSSKTTWISWTVFIAIIFGCLSVALICFCGALFFLKFRSPRNRKNPAKVVYIGPIRDGDEKERIGSLGAKHTVHCKSGEISSLVYIKFQLSSVYLKNKLFYIYSVRAVVYRQIIYSERLHIQYAGSISRFLKHVPLKSCFRRSLIIFCCDIYIFQLVAKKRG